MNKLASLFAVLISLSAISQEKKTIDQTDYKRWKTIKTTIISNDGKYIAYETAPEKGDSYLYIYNTETEKTDSIHRGVSPEFSGSSSYLAFKIKPGVDTLRTCELEKIKKSKWPKDSLGIYVLSNDSLIKLPKLGSFQLNDENDCGAFHFQHNKIKEPKKRRRLCKKKREKVYSSRGHALWIFNPAEDSKMEFKNVSRYAMSEKGNYVAMSMHRKYKFDSLQLNVFNTVDQSLWTADQQYTDVQKLTWDDNDMQLAYLRSSDTSKIKSYNLALFNSESKADEVKADSNSVFMPEDQTVSIHYSPRFTVDGKMVYFGAADIKHEEPKDTLLDSEKVKLDLWHHKDQRLQPQQLKELRRDEKRSDLYVYHLADNKGVRLSNDTLRASADTDLKGDYILAYSKEKYEHTYNWVSPRPMDYYRVNVKTGASELIGENILLGLDLAPSGKTFVMFDDVLEEYVSRDIETKEVVCLTCEVEGAIWTHDMNGQPRKAYPRGIEGWSPDESKVYIQSRYDLWEYDFEKGYTSNLTMVGAENQIRITPEYWSYDSVYFDNENVYFKGFDEKTKGTHIYNWVEDGDHWDLRENAYFDASVNSIDRSKDGSRSTLRKMTFSQYPDVYTYTTDINELTRVSNANPHQSEYKWGTVELTKWKSYKGIELEGLVYKPEDFDPNKSYPMIAYFYELNSDNLHRYWTPKPTRAALVYSIAEYVSAGYVIFIPDVRYEEGHPANSAYDCILSGTDHLLETYPNIDSNRMALQGQSWGGYQTAQLVTMTNRYAAAMAGAPVTNMFSAYGGIRWGSGYNRQFQYERTQSRIGHTIWERPDLYIENSPQFHLPKVETPLLIMHNDGDGAVPWYQGIELFTGLKRLDKEAWLLNYNDDGHNLMRYANRMDLSIRMRQFFDYYLLNEEAPQWLLDGIPATDKGKDLRY